MDAGWDDDYPLPRDVLEAAERYERNASPDRLTEEEEQEAMQRDPQGRPFWWAIRRFTGYDRARLGGHYTRLRRRRHPSPAPSRDTGPGE